MKQLLCILAVLCFAAGCSQAQADLIAQIHFLGGEEISADTNSPGFTNEFCSAAARVLENQALDKLSAAPTSWFKAKLPSHAIDGSKQLRPLLDDFLKSEWIFEMRDTTNGSPEYALAIRLDNQRAQLWSANLRALVESWTAIHAQNTSDGWRLKKDLPPNLFQFSRRGDWVILDCGQNDLSLGNEVFASATKTAETNWLTASVDWPRLAQLYPTPGKLDFPKFSFQTVGYEGCFYISGSLDLAQPLPPLEKWRVPTNEISQPFDSFTAARGLGPWLEKQDWFRPFRLQPQPDQFFIWALPGIPFETYGAEPVPNANAALAQIRQRLTGNTNWQNQLMPLKVIPSDGKILFSMPFMSPYLQADHETNGDFLTGGFLPNWPGSGPLPEQLAGELNTPGTVYYHWELTQDRLKELPELTQLILMTVEYRQLGDSAAESWLKSLKFKPGPTITVAGETTPTQVQFIRTAPGGLTALEFLALANWLDSPNFPSLVIPKAVFE
ncbi:MAG TPA: hypothetical protein VGI03_08070 [Verrucomicrobiae bacterium]|jgi:hypothetical protein